MSGTGARINQQLRTGDVIVAGTLYEHDYGSLTRNDMVYRPFNSPVNGAEVENKFSPEKTPELFDKYLPYALALDCELAWAQQFSTVLEDAKQSDDYTPYWYVGNRAFPMLAFPVAFGASFSNAIASSTTTPGSSSGTGGGGFSGGGGGGRGRRRLVGSIHP
jgi:hypothetical protein